MQPKRSRFYKRLQQARLTCTWVGLGSPASGGVLTMDKEHGPLGPNLSPSIYGLCNLELNHSEPQFPLLRNGHHDLYLTRLACRASETMQAR